MLKRLSRLTLASAVRLFVLASVWASVPAAYGADYIRFNYSILGGSIAVDDLEQFAHTGTVRGNLKWITNRLTEEQHSQLQTALLSPYDLDAALIGQFAYTASGEQLLQEAGELMQTPSGQNGFYSIRAALLLAASDPDGLSVLSLLQHWPTNIHIDIRQVLSLIGDVTSLLGDTQNLMQALPLPSTEALLSADTAPLSPSDDLRQPGPFPIRIETVSVADTRPLWTAHDSNSAGDSRPAVDRPLAFDLYQPEQPAINTNKPSTPIPVVVISNGLGARRDRFEEVANHLASHGYAVVALDHPGSDRQRLQDFYRGLYSEHFDATEYIDRPLDISAVLDYLQEQPYNLNTENVGVLGYSFGGTTALSLAGATIDRSYLSDRCQSERAIVNISLLYQCRALALPTSRPSLKDERIQAVYVFVPFGRSLFGPEGLANVDIPVFWEATDLDILTPLAIEQWPAFQWLKSRHRYMAIAQGLPHARLTLDAVNRLTGQSVQWETLKPITIDYHNMLSLGFFSTHLLHPIVSPAATEQEADGLASQRTLGQTLNQMSDQNTLDSDRFLPLMHPDYPLRLVFPDSTQP